MLLYRIFRTKTAAILFWIFSILLAHLSHEIGHLLFGLIYGYKIDQICLYRTTKKALHSGGTLGFVKMHHENRSFLQKLQGDFGQFFISIGPLLFGPCLIYIISLFLPENVRTLPLSFQQNWTIFFKALQQLQASDIIFLFIFLYIIMGISLNMELSRQDLHLACKGLLFLEVFFLIFIRSFCFISLESAIWD